DGILVESFPHEGPVYAVVALDGKRVIGAGADKVARLWSSSLVWQSRTGKANHHAAVSPKGEVFVAGDEPVIRVLNLADGKELRALPANDSPYRQLALSPDGTRLAALDAKRVQLWDLTAKAEA